MASTVNASVKATQINSLDGIRPKAAKASMPVKGCATANNAETTPVHSVDCAWVDSLHAVFDHAGMSRKEGAYVLGVDPAQLSRGSVGIDRLGRLPLKLQQAYLELVCARAGLKVSKAHKTDELLDEFQRSVTAMVDLIRASHG